MSDLDTIMNDRTESRDQNQPEPSQNNAPEPVAEGQARDEHGRFAGQQPAPEAPVAQPEAGKPPEGYIPIQALDARLSKQEEKYQAQLREQADAFQRQLASFQQPKPPATPQPAFNDRIWEDPQAAIDSHLKEAMQPIQQGQQGIVENFSRMMAMDKFGEEAVNSAYSELANRMRSNPQASQYDYQRIMSSPHPFGELVKWHKAQSALSQYGDDPTAYREKLRAELMAEMQAQPQQQAQPNAQPAAMPQSFTNARSPGGGAAPQSNGPVPLSELMGR